jgi:hypothetical protein
MPEMNKHFWNHWNMIKIRYGAYFKLLAWADYENG